MLPAWLLCIEQAQGAYALRKDAKTAIPGGLSADHPWPAMLYSGRMLPSLHVFSGLYASAQNRARLIPPETGSLAARFLSAWYTAAFALTGMCPCQMLLRFSPPIFSL